MKLDGDITDAVLDHQAVAGLGRELERLVLLHGLPIDGDADFNEGPADHPGCPCLDVARPLDRLLGRAAQPVFDGGPELLVVQLQLQARFQVTQGLVEALQALTDRPLNSPPQVGSRFGVAGLATHIFGRGALCGPLTVSNRLQQHVGLVRADFALGHHLQDQLTLFTHCAVTVLEQG